MIDTAKQVKIDSLNAMLVTEEKRNDYSLYFLSMVNLQIVNTSNLIAKVV